MDATSTNSLAAGIWLGRLRLAAGAALVWALLFFLVPGHGSSHVIVLSAMSPALAAPLAALLLVGGGLAATFITGRRTAPEALFLFSAGLAIWSLDSGLSYAKGPIDTWLLNRHEHPGPPTGGAYVPLIWDYVILLILAAAICALSSRGPLVQRVRQCLGLPMSPETLQSGIAALLITCAAATAVIMLLIPRVGDTWRQQVWAALIIGFAAGTMVASRYAPRAAPVFFWLAPFVLGLIGALVAAWRPALMIPARDSGLDVWPAWPLARATPVEFVGVGLAATIWAMSRGPARAANPEAKT